VPHNLDEGKQLSQRPQKERLEFISKKGLHFGCLNKEHMSKECIKKRICRICKVGHPAVLHRQSSLRDEFKRGINDNKKPGDFIVNNDQKRDNIDDVTCIASVDSEKDLHNLVKVNAKRVNKIGRSKKEAFM